MKVFLVIPIIYITQENYSKKHDFDTKENKKGENMVPRVSDLVNFMSLIMKG